MWSVQLFAIALCGVALFAPIRLAVLAWLLLVNFDLSGRDFEAESAVGLLNAVKAVVVPAVLCWRTRRTELTVQPSAAPLYLWCALGAYAALAIVWSPFPLAALKLVANLMGLGLGVVVLVRCYAIGVLDTRLLVVSLGLSGVFGAWQTFVVAEQSFGFSRSVGSARFTSFTASQQYAAWIVAVIAVLLSRQSRLGLQWALAAAGGVLLVANGSRTWLACYAVVIVAFGIMKSRSMKRVVSLACLAAAIIIAVGVGRLEGTEDADVAGLARVQAALEAWRDGTQNLLAVDTVGWRMVLYEDLVAELRAASTQELLFGHGTSAAYEVVSNVAGIAITDPNRAAHNEWLRVVHEWGLIGLCIWSAIAISIIRWVKARTDRSTLPLVAYGAGLFVATIVENVFASAGAGVGVGLALVGAALASAAATDAPSRPRPENALWRMERFAEVAQHAR